MVEAGRVTAIIDGDISGLTSKLNEAKSQSVTAVSGIEADIKSKFGSGLSGIGDGLSKSLSGGDFIKAGKELGGNLVTGIADSFGPLGSAAGEVATALGPVGIAAIAGTAAIIGLGSASVQAASEWQSGMSQISKTTGVDKGTAELAGLSADLLNLSATMPVAASEIQGVATSAGSLGIASSEIAGFTSIALQMGTAFDIPAEQAAVAIGKIKGQLKGLPEGVTGADEFAQHFGSAVDSVGNNLNATEADVLNFATRVSGTLSGLGANAYEIAGWGGVLSSVFPSAELAAGSFDSAITNLTTNTDAQSAATNLLGISTEEFMKQMSTDPTATLLSIGQALEGLPADKVLEVSKALGGSYGMDVFTKMIGHTEEWKQAIEETVEAGNQGSSIGNSFEAAANTASAQLQVLKGSVNAIFVDIGGPILDAFTPVISGVATGLNGVRAIGENLWEPFTTAVSPATEAVSLLASGIGGVAGMSLDGLVAGSKAINTAFQVGKAFVSAFTEEITKIIESSSTFQTLSGYVDQASDAFGRLKDWAGETFDKIVSGLSDAIPTAISGVTGAVGTLMDKAGLGGVTDALGGVSGLLGDVYDNAAKKLGWDAGDKIGEGIEESDKLKKAPGEALGSDDAISGTQSAAEDLAKAFSDAQAAYIKSHSSGGYSLATMMMMAGQDGTGDLDDKIMGQVEIGGGIFTRVNYDINDNFTGYRLSTPTGTYEYSSYQDFVNSAPKDLEEYVGRPLTELEEAEFLGDAQKVIQLKATAEAEVDTYLNFADNLKDEMAGAGEEINSAFLEGLTPDRASVESRLQNIRLLKLYDPEEAKRQGADNAMAYLTSLGDALDSYEKAKVEYLAKPDNEYAKAEFDRTLGNLQAIADQNPIKAKVDADTSLFGTKMDDLAGSVDLKKLISDPGEFKKTVMDIPEFMENTWQPAMQEEITFFKTQWHSGIGGAQQETEDFLSAMNYAADNMPLLFTPEQMDILDRYTKGVISAGEAIDALSAKAEKAGEKAKESSVGWDALKETMKGCEEEGEGLGCALSDFAKWQEAQTDLFQGSYIGQGGSQYLDWKLGYMQQIADTQDAMRIIGGSVLGEDYTQKVQEVKMRLSVDKTEADAAITDIETKAKKEQKMPVKVDDEAAKTTITAVETEAQKPRTMPLKIDDSHAKAAIAGIDAAASRPVTKIVYVEEVGSGGGGDSSWLGSGGNIPTSWQDWSYYLPFYGAGDVFVPQPTLAVVGDRPGGEWIGSIDQAVARFGGKPTGQNIIINYSPVINGANLSAEELEDLLEEHDEKLIAKIAEAKNR
jgi:TP901 family phage tail tape measure protein